MTLAEQIIVAVEKLVGQDSKRIFTREEVRHQAGVSREAWDASYSPIFQGMRVDHPGGAPKVAAKFQGVFQQVAHGKHSLTDYGRMLIQKENSSLQQLHDRATRDGSLTDAERARLEAWYEQQDAAEYALLGSSTASVAASVQSLRRELETASAQLLTVTQHIQTLVEENNALRQEIASLSQQLARTASPQPV